MNKYAVYYSPGFYGESEGMIHVWGIDVEDVTNDVLHGSGVGFRKGNKIFPTTVNRVVNITPAIK